MEKMTTLQKTTDCGLLRTIRWIFMAVMALILLLLHDEASFMLAAIVPMAAAFALCIYIYKTKHLDYDRVVRAILPVLLALQLYIAYNICFDVGWDVGGITRAAKLLSNYDLSYIFQYWYTAYPNNMLITYIEAFILILYKEFGFGEVFNGMMGVIIVNCVINTFACLLVYKTAKLFVRIECAFFSFLLVCVLVGLSPWTVVCYSDSICLAFSVLCLYLYAKPTKKKLVKIIEYVFAIAIASAAFYIKPQCFIVFIAAVIVEIISEKPSWRRIVAVAGSVLLACAVLFVTQKWIDMLGSMAFLPTNREDKLGASHFFMMGLNEQSTGAYSEEDVEFSMSFATAAERREANLAESARRIKNFGFFGLLKHWGIKLWGSFNDGTFAWGEIGVFYREIYDAPNTKAAPFLRSIYYNGEERFKIFDVTEQITWILTLMLAFLSALRKEKKNGSLNALWLTAVGIAMYIVLFEQRARYVYIFAPVFCVLAAVGLETSSEMIGVWLGRKDRVI